MSPRDAAKYPAQLRGAQVEADRAWLTRVMDRSLRMLLAIVLYRGTSPWI